MNDPLAEVHGAIPWIGFTFQADLVAKIAFGRARQRVQHLSRPSHGFSMTLFGMRVLYRMQNLIEGHYIDKRKRLNTDSPNSAIDGIEWCC